MTEHRRHPPQFEYRACAAKMIELANARLTKLAVTVYQQPYYLPVAINQPSAGFSVIKLASVLQFLTSANVNIS